MFGVAGRELIEERHAARREQDDDPRIFEAGLADNQLRICSIVP